MIAIIGMGTRASLGLFLEPMSSSLSWSRETYALAMAIQNLLWGILLPFAGALTDRYGASWVISPVQFSILSDYGGCLPQIPCSCCMSVAEF